jgi:hypothetical protein
MMRRQSGMISVESRKCITVLLSFCWWRGEKVRKRVGKRGWGGRRGKGKGKSYLDEGTDDTEGSEAQVLEGARFGRRIQERIQEEGYMCYLVASVVDTRREKVSVEAGTYHSRRVV